MRRLTERELMVFNALSALTDETKREYARKGVDWVADLIHWTWTDTTWQQGERIARLWLADEGGESVEPE